MKKIVLISMFLILATSCKKDYVCECTISPGNFTGKVTIKGVSKKTAKDICVSSSYVDVDNSTTPPTNTTVNQNCTLK
jgi:hypothetical protein